MRNIPNFLVCLALLCICGVSVASPFDFIADETLLSDTEDMPPHLRDRGEGVPSSMFGTYVTKGQILVYPFFEYYHDTDMEYSPDEFGYSQVHDYRGD